MLIPYFFLESSLINPDLAPELLGHTDFATGYEDFVNTNTTSIAGKIEIALNEENMVSACLLQENQIATKQVAH